MADRSGERAVTLIMEPVEPPKPTIAPGAIVALMPRLRRHAVALTGSVADGEDLAQDCIERALSRLDSVQQPDGLYGWLLAILHNLFLSDRRRQMRRGLPVCVDDLADSLADRAAPADPLAIRDLVRAMACLSEDQRQILLLSALEGLSYREMSAILDVPLGTIMSRLARAREKLRVLLDGGTQTVVRRVK